MDQSILRLPDPVPGGRKQERRRSVRQKLHTPVYASFSGPQTGMLVDLSELLDLHEDGFAVQTSERLEMNRAVTLSLDLPETKSYIHSSGQVVWSDDAGRGCIRFSGLSESSRQILKQWLFANLLIACSNHAARTEQLTRRKNDEEKLAQPVLVNEAPNVVPISDQSEILSRVEMGLAPSQTPQSASLQVEAVRREVHEFGDDVEAVLQHVTEHALSLTGASGAALALLTEGKMVCRARAGEPAPPLGAPVDAKQGLSGECVRNGLLVSCEDTGNDPRIDPEVCRALGIGSLMATPIVSDFRVVGLLEIFSPLSRNFTKVHETVLDRLVEMIPKTHREKRQPESIQPEATQPETAVTPEAAPQPPSSESGSTEPGSSEITSMHATREALWEQKPELSEQVSQPVAESASGVRPHLLHWTLLGLAILAVAMALGYLVGSTMPSRWTPSPQASQPSLGSGAEAASTGLGQSATERSSSEQHPPVKSLADLRKLAERGDPEAQWQMGVRYYDGDGVPHDDAQAMKWFELAAEQGHINAQSRLGAYYWAGRGVPVDLFKSYFWSTIAMHQGDEISKGRLEGLSLQMTRAQVAAASQQADDWLRQHNSAKSAKN